MESNESLVVEAGSEIITDIGTQEIARETPAWLKELSSFATAMFVTSAAVVAAGALVILFCYAFFVTAPIAVAAIALATARGVRRGTALAR